MADRGMWIVVHQNDHDDAKDHFNMIGGYTSEQDARDAIMKRELGVVVRNGLSHLDVTPFWFGHDTYWIIKLYILPTHDIHPASD